MMSFIDCKEISNYAQASLIMYVVQNICIQIFDCVGVLREEVVVE